MDSGNKIGCGNGMQIIVILLLLKIHTISCMAGMQKIPYTWKSVQIHGGGYVTGFVFSRAEPGILYARTDVGGAYRWQASDSVWIPLSDGWESTASWGVLSMATHPTDSYKVYAITGRGAGSFRYSRDRGATWTVVSTPFRVDGNMEGRGTGERLQVDTRRPEILYFGSAGTGLYRSQDEGNTWTSIASFPRNNITFVHLDSTSSVNGQATRNIIVGTADNRSRGDTLQGNIFRSTDGGNTWHLIPGQPTKVLAKSWFATTVQYSRPALPQRVAQSGDFLWFTFMDDLAPAGTTGGVYSYNMLTGVWRQHFPVGHTAQGGYCAVTVHPHDSRVILVGSLGRWFPRRDEMHLTRDGGETWININDRISWGNPHGSSSMATSWMSDVQINPFNANHAIFNSGASTHQTYNLLQALVNQPTHWDVFTKGIEETVIIGLTSSPQGAPLYSAIGDIGGFRHFEMDSPAQLRYNTGHGNTYNIDFAESIPAFMVRSHDGGGASYSIDHGVNWHAFPVRPPMVKRGSFISVSADAKTIIWAAADSAIYRSADTGKSWQEVRGLFIHARPISDRMNGAVFYVGQASQGRVWRSIDSGKTFVALPQGFPRTWRGTLTPSFAREGGLWMSLGTNGLHQSEDGGQTWRHLSSVEESIRIALGRPLPGSNIPALYLNGRINGQLGLWRSLDAGFQWFSIHDGAVTPYSLPRVTSHLTADRQVFGRVFAGTGGRGIFYGITTIPDETLGNNARTVQAESWCLGTGTLENSIEGYTGAGFFNFESRPNSTLGFRLRFRVNESMRFRIRYANGSSENRALRISFSGHYLGEISIPSTGAWTQWAESEMEVTVAAGEGNLVLTAPGAAGGPNVDWIGFSSTMVEELGCPVVSIIPFDGGRYPPRGRGTGKYRLDGKILPEGFAPF